MPINISVPDLAELKPRITVFGVGGGGCNAVNNMINSNLTGVEFVVANTDAQALANSPCERKIQMGVSITQGLGAGSQPEIGAAAAEETKAEIEDHLSGSHMVFITAGMGGGTGTGAAPVIASLAREHGILTVGVVTKPFDFEGRRRMAIAERGIETLAQNVDTLIVIPNQNLFRVANEATSFTAAFQMADQVLFSGVASITELMTKEGLINLDFADVRAVMSDMGKAMMGTGEASGESRAEEAALAAISNPLLDIDSMSGARGVLISIAGGPDLTLYEVDQAASRIREEVDPEANIIVGATIEEDLEGTMRVSVVATGLSQEAGQAAQGANGSIGGSGGNSGSGNASDGNGAAARNAGMAAPIGLSAPGTSGGVYPAAGMPQSSGATGERQAAPAASVEVVQPKSDPVAARPVTEAASGATDPKPTEAAPELRGTTDSSADSVELPRGEAPHAPEMADAPERPATEGIATDSGKAGRDGEKDVAAGTPEGVPAGSGSAPKAGESGGFPGIEDMPMPIRALAEKKQQAIQGLSQKKPSTGPRKRDFLLGKVKEMFGRGQEAPSPKPAAEPSAMSEPQRQSEPVRKVVGGDAPAAGVTPSPLQDDDDLSIPAFLRRSK